MSKNKRNVQGSPKHTDRVSMNTSETIDAMQAVTDDIKSQCCVIEKQTDLPVFSQTLAITDRVLENTSSM